MAPSSTKLLQIFCVAIALLVSQSSGFQASSPISSKTSLISRNNNNNNNLSSSLFSPRLTPKNAALYMTPPSSSSSDAAAVSVPTTKDAVIESSSSLFLSQSNKQISPLKAIVSKILMISYVVSLCILLPLTLLPQRLLPVSKLRKERFALFTSQFCCRLMLKIFPFCNIQCISDIMKNKTKKENNEPEPTIWVCNHTSMLDVFILLASDHKLRGKNRRPIKIVYWKQLEDNPVTKLMFQQAGFIPVDMAANKAGEDNSYDVKSFKNMLKLSKKAFKEGFDLGILPEGQLNPTPHLGLLPVFPGAFTLARMSRRPIQMMALYGAHNLWHPDDNIGMTVTDRNIQVRAYTDGTDTGIGGRKYSSSEEFVETFTKVVGHFGTYGKDDDSVISWLDGSIWQQKLVEEQQAIAAAKEEAERKKREEEEAAAAAEAAALAAKQKEEEEAAAAAAAAIAMESETAEEVGEKEEQVMQQQTSEEKVEKKKDETVVVEEA